MKVIVFGTSDFARQLKYYLDTSDEFQLEYFCVSREYYKDEYFLNKQVLILEEIEDKASPKEYKFILGIGYSQLRARNLIFDQIKEKGYDFINYINPTAKVYGKIIGEGNIILSNVLLEPFSKIGNNNIIWSNSLICHDATIGNNNFIAAGTIVGGHSKVLDSNFLGFDSTIKENVVVNKEVLVGAKSLILNSPEDCSLYYGIPARKVSEHKQTGIMIK